MATAEEMERERNELISAMAGMADRAPEPGTLRIRDVIHKGDDEVPAPMMVSTLDSAGYIFIYDTRTGQRSLTNRNMVGTQLGKRRSDGSPVFTIHKPNIDPPRGKHPCMLHSSHPRRADWDAMHLPECGAGNLASEYEVKRHMQVRHSTAYQAIQDLFQREKEERERQVQEANLTFQRDWMEKMAAKIKG